MSEFPDRPPFNRPVLAVRLELADGQKLERDWSLRDPDFHRAQAAFQAPPVWLHQARRHWPHPQDPITFTGVVEAGREAEAWDAVYGV